MRDGWRVLTQYVLFVLITLIALATVAYIAIMFGLLFPRAASAQTSCSAYDYTYNLTNLYSNYTLIYQFDNLCSTHQYVFRLETYNPLTGDATGVLDHWFAGDGATDAERVFSPIPIIRFTQLGTNVIFMRVRDDYGQTLGRHVFGLQPGLLVSNNNWTNSLTHATSTRKTAIGNILPAISPVTTDAPLHQPDLPSLVTTRRGDFVLLHYRADHTSAPTGEQIQIRRVTGDVEITLQVDALATFNTHPDWDWGMTFPDGVENHYNFVVLYTGNDTFNFPLSLNMSVGDTGVYEYVRLDDMDNEIANGESLWVVVNHSQVEFECIIERPVVVQARNQAVIVTNRTSNVWDGLQTQLLQDSLAGDSGEDLLSLIYNSKRRVSYSVGSTPGAATVHYRVVSDEDSAYILPLTLDDYPFRVLCGSYSIIEAAPRVSLWDNIERVLPDDNVTILAGMLGVLALAGWLAFSLGAIKFLPLILLVMVVMAIYLGLLPAWFGFIAVLATVLWFALLLRGGAGSD